MEPVRTYSRRRRRKSRASMDESIDASTRDMSLGWRTICCEKTRKSPYLGSPSAPEGALNPCNERSNIPVQLKSIDIILDSYNQQIRHYNQITYKRNITSFLLPPSLQVRDSSNTKLHRVSLKTCPSIISLFTKQPLPSQRQKDRIKQSNNQYRNKNSETIEFLKAREF